MQFDRLVSPRHHHNLQYHIIPPRAAPIPASQRKTLPLPAPSPAETSGAYKAIEKLKNQKAPLSTDQQQLDAAEKTFARKTEDNILKQQAAIEKRGGKLHEKTAKALADAQAKLGPQGAAAATPFSSDGVTPATGTPSSQRPIPHPTTQSGAVPDSRQPAQSPSAPASSQLPVPSRAEASDAYKAIEKLNAQKRPLSPDQQAELNAAEKTFARKTEDNILQQQAAIEKRGGKLHPTTAKALSDAQAKLAPQGPATATHSSSGDLPPGASATTDGVAPPIGNSTAPGMPETTITPEEIALAKKRVTNLGNVQARRPLGRTEQRDYNKARDLLDRIAPEQPGSRNTSNPQDLVLAGGDPAPKTHEAAAETPYAPPAQPANAIGATIKDPEPANPDAPRDSANDDSVSAGTPGVHQPQAAQPDPGPMNTATDGSSHTPSTPPGSIQGSDAPSLPQSGPAPAARQRLAAPPEHTDPRLKEIFKNWPHGWDEQGLPHPPRTLPDDHPLVVNFTVHKKTVRLSADHPLVATGLLPAGQDIARKFLHDAIVNHLIHQATPLPFDAEPTIYALGGGGGSGKSSLYQKLMNEGLADAKHVVRVDADDIKKYIPEYEEMRAKGEGRAASIVQSESARIADSLLKKLMESGNPKFDIAYDSTMANAAANLRRIVTWKSAGRRVHLIGVTIDPKEAAVRAAIRALDEGRWVPSEILAKAHQGFNEALPHYLPEVDAAEIYDNSSSDFDLLARKTNPTSDTYLENSRFWTIIKQRSHAK